MTGETERGVEVRRKEKKTKEAVKCLWGEQDFRLERSSSLWPQRVTDMIDISKE